jgi:general secretion pathway protein I
VSAARRQSSRCRARGFSLLEVLIALVIVALALFALVQSAGVSAVAIERERDVTFATWVAANVMADARLGATPGVGRRSGSMRMGPREWFWEMVVQGTEEPSIRRLDVRVYADEQHTAPAASLTGFSGQR